MTWRAALANQLDFYWAVHLWPRLAGLTDDEYLWEPVEGSWNLRRRADGRWQPDTALVEPPLPPVTTIAWRIVHVGRDVLGKRAHAFFGDDSLPEGSLPGGDTVMFDDRWGPEPLPGTAEDALAFLQRAFGLWRDGVAGLDDEALLRPLGPRGGPFADDTMAALVLHINREVMAHGAEICLLRDLYRARRDRENPLVAAALRGDAGEVVRLLEVGESTGARSAPLVVEAAGLEHWDVVRALLEHGLPVGGANPSALHYAAAAGRLDVVRLLLAHGADAELLDPGYRLPAAGWADFFGHPEVGEFIRSFARRPATP